MGSAHCLTEMNIFSTLNGKGDIERARISRENQVALNCDLNFEPA